MDRRQKRTREAIFEAFSVLLEKKRVESITVQEIIDEAGIGRSTFYDHFATKDDLLRELCGNIFSHVLADDFLHSPRCCDFIAEQSGLHNTLVHLLYHLRDSRKDMVKILSCESGEVFMEYFRESLVILFQKNLSEDKASVVPRDFLLHHLAGSFACAVQWWIGNRMEPTPEEVASYYYTMIAGGIEGLVE